MKQELKIENQGRPVMTVIRNPALLPSVREDKSEEVPVASHAGTRNEKTLRMPKEPTGYIKCRKHDFF